MGSHFRTKTYVSRTFTFRRTYDEQYCYMGRQRIKKSGSVSEAQGSTKSQIKLLRCKVLSLAETVAVGVLRKGGTAEKTPDLFMVGARVTRLQKYWKKLQKRDPDAQSWV